MDALERALRRSQGKDKLIIVDGVFSMEGDIVDLPAILRLAKAYGARIMLDDAHAIAFLEMAGRGTAEHFGLENEVDLSWEPSANPCRDRRLCRRAIRCDQLDQTRCSLDDLQRQSPPLPGGIGEYRFGHHCRAARIKSPLWRNTHKMLNGYKRSGTIQERAPPRSFPS